MSQTFKQITVSDMAPHIHNFVYGENKVAKLTKWMTKWIKTSLDNGKIKPNDRLPLKGELACHIGVSLGTMQNVYRLVEDSGYIYSKQKKGSFIKEIQKSSQTYSKLTSLREIAIEKIKSYMLENNYKANDTLISARKLAEYTGISVSTIRSAINCLVLANILTHSNKKFIIKNMNFEVRQQEIQTLSDKITNNLKEYITNAAKNEYKLPSNKELAKIYGVSIKTIHDAIKTLCKEGIVITKRGTYGTIISKSTKTNELYYYEKAELKIKHFISENCQIGSKLPPISEFAKILNVSTKTIKKALDNLSDDGYITSSRGRLGGTFVTDIPQKHNEAYKWIAINPNYHSS